MCSYVQDRQTFTVSCTRYEQTGNVREIYIKFCKGDVICKICKNFVSQIFPSTQYYHKHHINKLLSGVIFTIEIVAELQTDDLCYRESDSGSRR